MLIHLNGDYMNIPSASFVLPTVRRHKHLTCPSHTLIIVHIIFHSFVGRCLFLSLEKICNLWKMWDELLQWTVLLCRKDWNTCTEMLYIFYRPEKVRGIQGTSHYSDTSCSLMICKWEHLNKQQQFKKNKNKSKFLVRKNTKIVLSKLWAFIIVNRICWL